LTKAILTDSFDVNRVISKLSDDAEIYASTFNVSTWLSNGPAITLLHEFNVRNTMLIVGVPDFKSCTGNQQTCQHCYRRHLKSIRKLASLRDRFSNIDWKFVREVHTKCVVAKPFVITGGRNVSDSRKGDVSFVDKDPALGDRLIEILKGYAAKAYDIGTNAPLVFTHPYRGELMADSDSITSEFKKEAIKIYDGNRAVEYWAKQ
jgi:hypothetical protein